jgi:hypothetical protein
MLSSPANLRRCPRAALAGIGMGTALALAGPVMAQTLGVLPVEISPTNVPDAPASSDGRYIHIPGPGESSVQPGQEMAPPPPPEEPQIRNIEARPGEAGSGIEIGTLDSGGVTGGPGAGNYSSNLWAGSSRETIERNLPKLSVGTGSLVMNDILRQVLLTSPSPDETANGAPSLLPLRLERLMVAGRPDWAAKLAQDARSGTSPQAMVWRARAELAAGDDAAACSTQALMPTGGDPASDTSAAFAMKLSTYCQIANGQKEAAIMTTDLAREEGLADPLFYSLAGQASDGITLKAAEPATLDALNAALYRKAGRAFPANALDIAEPALLAGFARDANLPVDMRIAAGERAAKLGAFSGTDLASLYAMATFTQADFDGLKTATFPAQPAMRRALLYHAIKRENDPAQRTYLFKLAFATGESAGLTSALAQVLKPELAGVPLTPEYKPLGPVAIRTFLLLDERMSAQSWYGFVGTDSAMFGRNARELSALMRINDKTRASWDEDQISGDIASDLSSGITSSSDFARLETVLLTALGARMEPAILAAVPEANEIVQNVVPMDPLLAELHAAASRKAVGETLMLSLIVLGEKGPAGASPRAAGEVVVALRAIGFEDDARRVATETLLARTNAGRG